MAIVKIDPTAAVLNDAATVNFTALDASDGIYVNYGLSADTRIGLLLQNTATSAATVTVVQGDGIGGVVDVAVTVPASGFAVVVLDSASFVLTKGEYKGYVHLTGPATVKAGPVALI